MSDIVEPTVEEAADMERRAALFEEMLVDLNGALEGAVATKADTVTVPMRHLASLVLSHETLLDTLNAAAERMMAVDAQAQALVNLNTVLVLRYGGEVKISAEELAATHGAKLNSAHDPHTMEQVLTVTRIDPTTGDEVQPSRIIVPGRLPLTRF